MSPPTQLDDLTRVRLVWMQKVLEREAPSKELDRLRLDMRTTVAGALFQQVISEENERRS